MGLRLFFLPNFPGAMFIQGATFIPDSRVGIRIKKSQCVMKSNEIVIFYFLPDQD